MSSIFLKNIVPLHTNLFSQNWKETSFQRIQPMKRRRNAFLLHRTGEQGDREMESHSIICISSLLWILKQICERKKALVGKDIKNSIVLVCNYVK
jgi:hypothetical protein